MLAHPYAPLCVCMVTCTHLLRCGLCLQLNVDVRHDSLHAWPMSRVARFRILYAAVRGRPDVGAAGRVFEHQAFCRTIGWHWSCSRGLACGTLQASLRLRRCKPASVCTWFPRRLGLDPSHHQFCSLCSRNRKLPCRVDSLRT